MKKTGFFLLLFVALIILATSCWAGEPLRATVTGENVNIREKPNTTAKVVRQVNASEAGVFIVDSATITDKASGLKWYRILYSVSEMDESTYSEYGNGYIASKFIQVRPFSAAERENHRLEVKRVAQDNAYKENGAWKITPFNEESSIYTQDDKVKALPVYADSSLKSSKVATLSVNTPVLLSVAKFRYLKSTGKNEGWVKITKPVTGWVPVESVLLAYSDFFYSAGMVVQ